MSQGNKNSESSEKFVHVSSKRYSRESIAQHGGQGRRYNLSNRHCPAMFLIVQRRSCEWTWSRSLVRRLSPFEQDPDMFY